MDDYSLLCSICIETYMTPRLIKACGHSFCEQCLFTYVTMLKEKGELGSTFPCPVCRQEVASPSDSNVTLSWIQTYPINEDLLDRLSKTPMETPAETEDNPTTLCDPCGTDNETYRAVKFCVDCQEHLCKDCVVAHRKYKIFHGHKLTEVVTRAELLHTFTDLPPTKCAVHTTRDIEMYCGRHDAYFCYKCLSLSHMDCDGLAQISEMESTALTRLESLKDNLEKSGKHIEVLLSVNDAVISSLPNNRQKMINQLKTLRDKIVTAIDVLIEHVEVQTKQQLIGLEAELTMKNETLKHLKSKCHNQCELIDTVSEYGLPIHKVLTQSKTSEELEKIERDIQSNGHNIVTIDFGFCGMEKLERLYGDLQTCSKKQVKLVRKWIDPTKHELARLSDVLGKDEHTLRLVPHCPPTYTGITRMDDTQLLLTDNREYNNVCGHVCLYDVVSKSITTQIKLNRPFSAAVLKSNPGHVVVSVQRDKKLHIVSIKGGQMATEKTFTCDKQPYSLISLDNGHVGVTWDSPPSFSIVDTSGNEMKTVKSFTEDSTGRKFKSFQYVAVDESRSHIIQPCSEDHTVYCFNYAGNPVFEYKDPDLRYPRGVDIDKNGFVYICSWGTSTVHVITTSGCKVKVFNGMPTYPQAISVEETGDRFWITSSFIRIREKLFSFSLVE